jgi:hypothetical protein
MTTGPDGASSGNRWEPGTGTTASDADDTASYPPPPAPTPVQAQATPRRERLKKSGIVGGVAAGVFLLGGAGGFAVGHATADDQDSGRDAGRVDGFGHHRPPGFGNRDGGPGFGEPPGGGGEGTPDEGSGT